MFALKGIVYVPLSARRGGLDGGVGKSKKKKSKQEAAEEETHEVLREIAALCHVKNP
jgi:hypothetical protein